MPSPVARRFAPSLAYRLTVKLLVAEKALVPFAFLAFACQKYVAPRVSRDDWTDVDVMPDRSKVVVPNVDERDTCTR